MADTDLDDAYANARHIPGAEGFPPRWEAAAAAFRDGLAGAGRAETGLAYGAHPRERFDLFRPAGPARGLVVFVHGGYWRAFGPGTWSHLAAGALAHGHAVAMPGYPLCPERRIRDITRSVARAVEAAAARVAGPIRLTGHSAGGHLVARMLMADAAPAPAVAARIARAVPISGLFDLRPLMRTAMNDDFRLDAEEAAAESPALGQPKSDVSVICWVGGAERPAFIEQSRILTDSWKTAGLHIEPGRHHFDVIDDLARPDSTLVAALVAG
jgi:acetyl esterase/lipase